MKILITGGAGFIGSSIVARLLKDGHKVTIIDNFNDYYNPYFKRQNIQQMSEHINFMCMEGDILEKNFLQSVFKQNVPDKVIHLAASVGVRNSLDHPEVYKRNNLIGTQNILDMVGLYGVKQFVFASSSSIYGNKSPRPFREDRVVDSALNPYAMTKKTGEQLCLKHHNMFNTPITICRFFTVYGPKGRPDMAPYIFTRSVLDGKKFFVFGDGTAKRDFTYIMDLVHGIMSVLENEFPFEVFNIGSSSPISINNFIRKIEKITGKKANIEYANRFLPEMRNTYANIQKAGKLLGYKPRMNIEDGLEIFIHWFKRNRAPL